MIAATYSADSRPRLICRHEPYDRLTSCSAMAMSVVETLEQVSHGSLTPHADHILCVQRAVRTLVVDRGVWRTHAPHTAAPTYTCVGVGRGR